MHTVHYMINAQFISGVQADRLVLLVILPVRGCGCVPFVYSGAPLEALIAPDMLPVPRSYDGAGRWEVLEVIPERLLMMMMN